MCVSLLQLPLSILTERLFSVDLLCDTVVMVAEYVFK
jgi:hypothetical protein